MSGGLKTPLSMSCARPCARYHVRRLDGSMDAAFIVEVVWVQAFGRLSWPLHSRGALQACGTGRLVDILGAVAGWSGRQRLRRSVALAMWCHPWCCGLAVRTATAPSISGSRLGEGSRFDDGSHTLHFDDGSLPCQHADGGSDRGAGTWVLLCCGGGDERLADRAPRSLRSP